MKFFLLLISCFALSACTERPLPTPKRASQSHPMEPTGALELQQTKEAEVLFPVVVGGTLKTEGVILLEIAGLF